MTDTLVQEEEATVIAPPAMGNRCFAVIGTRDPDKAQEMVAFHFAFAVSLIAGCQIHTGGAYGIDQKAMEGTRGRNLTVFLPWDTYNRVIIPRGTNVVVYNPSVHTDWAKSVRDFHPAWSHLSSGSFALHARNYGIVSNCEGVLAFPNEYGEGGTGQGIRIARELGIPLVQANKGTIEDAPRFLGKTLQFFGFADKGLAATIPAKKVSQGQGEILW